MWTICSSQYGGGRVTRRLNRNSWRSVTGIAARMSYSTLDFRFLIPRGHHCDRRVVNGIVFRTTAIFYLPTTHERRRGEEAVSRHRGREIVDPCGGVVERYSRIKSYKWVVIHFPWFWFMPPRGFVLLIHIKGACPRFKQSPTYLIFAFQACQPPRSQKGKNSTVDRFFVNRVWTDFQGLKSGSGFLILTKFRRISLTFFIIFFFFFTGTIPMLACFNRKMESLESRETNGIAENKIDRIETWKRRLLDGFDDTTRYIESE